MINVRTGQVLFKKKKTFEISVMYNSLTYTVFEVNMTPRIKIIAKI